MACTVLAQIPHHLLVALVKLVEPCIQIQRADTSSVRNNTVTISLIRFRSEPSERIA